MPDAERTRAVLDALEHAAPGAVLMWRGAGLGGGDVDLVVCPGRDSEVVDALRSSELSPWPESPGQTVWRSPGMDVVLDVWSGWSWPGTYPPLEDVLRRSGTTPEGWRLAAPEDRLAIFAAEAVAGRPLASLRPKVARALAEPGAAARLRELTDDGLTAVVVDGLPDGDVLSARRALRAAVGSPRGRAALLDRLRGTRPAHPPAVAGAPPGRLITLSGMDGSGKSSAGLALAAEFEQRGSPAMVAWTRLGTSHALLHRIARPVRAALGREMGVSSQIDTASAVADRVQHATPAQALPPLVGSTWVALVALSHVRHCRRLARVRASGVQLVCDRWLADALVDVRLRYGDRSRIAEWLLRTGMPRPDVALLLEVGPEAAARRKPGDQDAATLVRMQKLYADLGRSLALTSVDAERPAEVVRDEVIDLAIGRRGGSPDRKAGR